jgi:hypothetical protein
MSLMDDPATRLEAVTKSDTTDLGPVRALYIGGTGDVAIRARGMTTAVTLASVPGGTILPIRAQYVYETGTDATGIVALY